MSYDQPGALDYWHSHALISGETRRDILQYCDMVSEPMTHFCGPSGGSKAAPAGAAPETKFLMFRVFQFQFKMK